MKHHIKKLFSILFLAGVFFIFQHGNVSAARCSLTTNKAYQYRGNAAIFFVTKNCTKQVFTSPAAFLERIGSWKNIKLVNKTTINKIPNNKNYFIYSSKGSSPVPANTNNSTPTTATPNTTQPSASPTPVATCNNMAKISATDGDYPVCLNNTIYHQPSGILAMIASMDDSQITLSLSGLPGNSIYTLIVYKNSTGQIGGNNGTEVTYKYGGFTSSAGGLLTISSHSSINATPPTNSAPVNLTPSVPIISPISSNVPKKFLTIVAVNNGASSKYDDNSWERTLKMKENGAVQIFEVAIWDNGQPTNPSKISVYKFDSTFDPFKSEYINGGSAWVQYRERYNILNIATPQSCKWAQGDRYYACSKAYLDAFKVIFKTITENQPAEHYGIKYLGHGTNGGLFENMISEPNSTLLLAYTNSLIGKKLDFLDWNTQCEYGTYHEVLSQYQYTDYILASDLIRSPGAGVGVGGSPDLLPPPEHSEMLPTFFSPGKSIRQSLVGMMDNDRTAWVAPSYRNFMASNQMKQSISIYDTSKFTDLAASTNLDQGLRSGDILNYIRANYPTQEQKFYDFRFHYVSNKDFFHWNEDSNGFRAIPQF